MAKANASRQHPRVEETLRQEWEGARRYLDLANAIFLVLNADGTVALINRRGCQFLGRKESQVVGRHWIDSFVPRRFRERLRADFAELLAGKAGHGGFHENPVLAADGQERLIGWRNTVLRNGQGRIVGTLSCGEDMTEHRKAEERLAQSEKRYRTLIEGMNEGVGSLDENGRVAFVNDRLCQMLGYRREELIGRPHASMLDRASRRLFRREFAKRKDGQRGQYEVGILRKDGGIVQGLTSATPIIGPDGRFQGGISVVMDITARKQAEEALRRNELLFRRLFEANVIGVISGEGDIITEANDRFLKMVGYTRADLKGGRLDRRKLTPPEYSASTQAMVRQMLVTGVFSLHQKEYIRKDGTRVPVEIGGALVSASPFRWVCFVADLTERRKAEAELQQAHDEMEKRVRLRTAELEAAYEDLRVSEEKYRQLFATETDAIVLMDGKRFQFIDANDSACRLFGYPREELLRTTQVDTSAEPDASRKALARTAREGRNFVPLRYHKKKDGTVFPVEISSSSFTLRGRRVLVGAIRDITKRVAAEEALHAARAKLLAAREEERRRLSQELHDSIGQRLVAAHLKLRNAAEIPSVARDPLFSAVLRDLLAQLGGLSAEVRDVSHALYPQTLEVLGLPATLRQLAKDVGLGRHVVTVRCEAAIAGERLAPQTEIALYRIAQEAVSNAIRHARCRRIDLRLSRSAAGQVCLTIADDGRGFNPAKAAGKGVGLTSMRERAESIAAAFELASRPGRTRVRVRVAMPKEN